MKTFFTVCSGQLVSLIGSRLTQFVLGVWVYEKTGSATLFALITFCAMTPQILISPLAGALVDRLDRRKVMIWSDSGAALCTLTLSGLIFAGQLHVWHIFLCNAIISTLSAFQTLAYHASISLLVPKEQLGRVNGLIAMTYAWPLILAPILAGMLISLIQVQGVLMIDVATFLVSLIALLLVRFPHPPTSAESQQAKGTLKSEMRQGLRFIVERSGLLGILIFTTATNLGLAIAQVSIGPLVLSFASAREFGIVSSVGGIGLLIGSSVLSAWGGPKRQIYGVLIFGATAGFSLFLFGIQPNVPILSVAAFCLFFSAPMLSGISQSIWQRKVPPDLQGRVLAMRKMVGTAAAPIAYLIAGPLIENFFEPLMTADGSLAPTIGSWIGTGPGRGVGLLFITAGLMVMLIAAVAASSPRLRLVEKELPDAI